MFTISETVVLFPVGNKRLVFVYLPGMLIIFSLATNL